jgi:hypothetical protein
MNNHIICDLQIIQTVRNDISFTYFFWFVVTVLNAKSLSLWFILLMLTNCSLFSEFPMDVACSSSRRFNSPSRPLLSRPRSSQPSAKDSSRFDLINRLLKLVQFSTLFYLPYQAFNYFDSENSSIFSLLSLLRFYLFWLKTLKAVETISTQPLFNPPQPRLSSINPTVRLWWWIIFNPYPQRYFLIQFR